VAAARYLRFLSVFALAAVGLLATEDGKPSADSSVPARSAPTLAPVLRNDEPADSRFVVLPGGPAAKALVEPPPASPAPKPIEVAERREPVPAELNDPGRPILHRAPRPAYPEDFEKDSGTFCQKQIGQWKEFDAVALFGSPAGDRPALDDNQQPNGRIYAFSDPTNRYKQLELDFDGETGALRTVFLYPWKMTWIDCRRIWGVNVSAADAAKGRKFYSYLNRRVDVLVDAAGKVISIGLY
jgi:hypothetical protein